MSPEAADLDAVDLDDAEALQRADTRGVLRSSASAGAQVRAVASAVEDGVLRGLDGIRPRAVVLVAGRGSAGRAAAIVVGALAGAVDVPLVRADRTPSWTGSLDLVVVAGDDAGDPVLAQAIADAVRRGAETVVTLPDEGPVGAAGAGYALRLPPRVSVLDANRMTHHLAAMLAVLAAIGGKVGQIQGSARELSQLADVLDGEALRGGPSRPVFSNAAKTLAARIQAPGSAGTVLAGDRPGTSALAEHAAAALLSTGGISAAAVELIDALAAPRQVGAGATDSIFYDPQFDEPSAALPLRVFVLSSAADSRETGMRMAGLPDAELVLAGDEPAAGIEDGGLDEEAFGHRATGPSGGAGGDAGVRPGPAMAAAELDDRPEITQLSVLAVRWELAAAYLSLAAAPDQADQGR